MMKFLILVTLAASAIAALPPYDAKFENINIDEIINNNRILRNYAECFLDKRPCVKEASEIKNLLTDALQTTCARCTPKQVKMIRKIDDALISKHKDVHDQLLKKYDPQNKFRGPFRRYIEQHS